MQWQVVQDAMWHRKEAFFVSHMRSQREQERSGKVGPAIEWTQGLAGQGLYTAQTAIVAVKVLCLNLANVRLEIDKIHGGLCHNEGEQAFGHKQILAYGDGLRRDICQH